MSNVLSVRTKLSAIAAAAAIAIIGLVGVHLWSSHQADLGFERLYGANLQPLVSLQAVDGPLREIRFRMAAVLIDQMPIPGSRNHLAESRPKIDAAWKHYRATISQHSVSPEIETLAAKIDAGLPGLARVLESLEAAYASNDRKQISTILEDDWPRVHMEIVKPLEQLRPTTEREAGAFFASASAARVNERLALAVGAGLLILALVVFTGITIRSIVRALRSAVAGAEALAAGDFKTGIPVGNRDEPGRVLNALRSVRSTIEAFLGAQAEIAKRHEVGNTDYRIDAAQWPGAYGELAQKVNEMVDDSIAIQAEFTALVQNYAQGDFTADMPRLAGERAAITAAADAVKRALQSLPAEVARLAAAAVRGDFSVRGDVTAYQAEFRSMMQSLNDLMEISRAGLNDANRMFSALARADLSPRVTSHYEGTFAELQQSANATMDQLGALIARIRAAADSIKDASTQIAQGNRDLSGRTEEQAASLEETAASIDELTAAVRDSAANAQAANKLAVSAVAVATRGGATVREVVETMAEIATSSARVADIVAVIDGIAFQTNILALNAAVEAARAGA
ncbi:MAG: methyl-accepting chemotaxis protein, partial [Burkholderiales bacterium]